MKIHAFSLATTTGAAYVACAIFDLLFPPYGLLVALAPHSPMPIFGSSLGYLAGFVMFTIMGFVLGGLYGVAWEFWRKKTALRPPVRRLQFYLANSFPKVMNAHGGENLRVTQRSMLTISRQFRAQPRHVVAQRTICSKPAKVSQSFAQASQS